jgi:hypothetical protein
MLSWLARGSVTVCWAAAFVLPDVQCPHPMPCYGHVRLEDAADNFAVGQHVEIVIGPFAAGISIISRASVSPKSMRAGVDATERLGNLKQAERRCQSVRQSAIGACERQKRSLNPPDGGLFAFQL